MWRVLSERGGCAGFGASADAVSAVSLRVYGPSADPAQALLRGVRTDCGLNSTRRQGAMNESQRNAIRKEIKRLRLAASDMNQVAAAAAQLTLSGVRLMEGAERIVHTGIVVAYVRPFRNAGIGNLSEDDWAPPTPEDRALHDRIVTLRDKVYAHTDNTEYRDIEDTSELLGLEGGPTYAESWVSLSPEGVNRIGRLAETQARRFAEGADELEYQLGRQKANPC